jgi:hypothetical protein
MKLTLTPTADQSVEKYPHLAVSVEIPNDDIDLATIFDSLIIPALIAFGFERKVIDDWMDGKEN